MLSVGDAAGGPHRREGLQEQVQPGGSRQFWVHATCSSGTAGCPARLHGGKSCVAVKVCCSLLQAIE